MISQRMGLGALCVTPIAAFILVTNVLDANAQTGSNTPNSRRASAAKEVTLTGRIVDLHCYMTGQMPSADAAKCTADCIRAGVPTGLETESGLIILGQGISGPAKTLIPFAYQEVQVQGKLFDRNGAKYLDIASVKKFEEPEDEDADEDDSEEDEE